MPGKLVGLLAAVALLLGLAAATSVPAGQASEQARAMPDGKVVVRKIKRFQRATWRWQRLMGVARTPNRGRYVRTRNITFRLLVLKPRKSRGLVAPSFASSEPTWSVVNNDSLIERNGWTATYEAWRTRAGSWRSSRTSSRTKDGCLPSSKRSTRARWNALLV